GLSAKVIAMNEYDKELAALPVIDPYNDFISEGGEIWGRVRRSPRPTIAFPTCCRSRRLGTLGCASSRDASPVPPGRLRDVAVPSADPAGVAPRLQNRLLSIALDLPVPEAL